jgi:hypothetical protein
MRLSTADGNMTGVIGENGGEDLGKGSYPPLFVSKGQRLTKN